LSGFGGRALSAVSLIFLKFWLAPEDFGFLMFASLTYLFMEALGNMGLQSFIAQRRVFSGQENGFIFLIEFLKGAMICSLSFSFSGAYCALFDMAGAETLICVAGCVYWLKSLLHPSAFMQQREMRFNWLAILSFTPQLAFLTLIPFLYWTNNEEPIMFFIAQLCGFFIIVISSFLRFGIPSINFSHSFFKEYLAYARKGWITSLFTFFQMNLAAYSVAFYLSVQQFADFYFIYALIIIPIQTVSKALGVSQMNSVAINIREGRSVENTLSGDAHTILAMGLGSILTLFTVFEVIDYQINIFNGTSDVLLAVSLLAISRVLPWSLGGIQFGLGQILLTNIPALSYVLTFITFIVLFGYATGVRLNDLVLALCLANLTAYVTGVFLLKRSRIKLQMALVHTFMAIVTCSILIIAYHFKSHFLIFCSMVLGAGLLFHSLLRIANKAAGNVFVA
jgi:O-antigen/teichoic acid export membrane protein